MVKNDQQGQQEPSVQKDLSTLKSIFSRRMWWLIGIVFTLATSGPGSFYLYQHFAKTHQLIQHVCERQIEDEELFSQMQLAEIRAIRRTAEMILTVLEANELAKSDIELFIDRLKYKSEDARETLDFNLVTTLDALTEEFDEVRLNKGPNVYVQSFRENVKNLRRKEDEYKNRNQNFQVAKRQQECENYYHSLSSY